MCTDNVSILAAHPLQAYGTIKADLFGRCINTRRFGKQRLRIQIWSRKQAPGPSVVSQYVGAKLRKIESNCGSRPLAS